MMNGIITTGVMVGALYLIGKLEDRSLNKKKDETKKFRVTVKHRVTGMMSEIIVIAKDRAEALAKVDETMKKDYIIRDIGRA